ncbi:MAG: transcriptional repressor NrdR [Oligoflexales bacterium]|nr:transcriptional repressor NrdR [Oligoflexales bacterium]
MKCPKCNHSETKVLESRLSHEGRSVRRRRCCLSCNYRFTTYEKEEELIFQVRKRDNRYEEFDRNKLIKAISFACIKRQVPIEKIESLVADVEHFIRSQGERIIPSQKIGDLVIEKLKKVDHVAYVRFASIYKDFKDTNEFISELDELKKVKPESTL